MDKQTAKLGAQALCRFKTLMTIKLGTGLKTADDFRKALVAGGYLISDWANDVIGIGKPAFTAATEETEVELVVVSVTELGFKDGVKRADIYKRAQELGLDLCPAEVGVQLRLQYKDQPKDKWLHIAMEPIPDSGGRLTVFDVGHSGIGLWLHCSYGRPGSFWNGLDRWVFVRHK